MERLLPPGSSVETDIPANTLHILTTPEAHAAVWEFLSAVDLPAPVPALETSAPVVELSDKLQKALERLASSAKRSDELAEALSSLRIDLARSRGDAGVRRLGDLRIQGGVAAAVLALAGFVLVRRLGRRRPESSGAPASPAPTIPADQIALALAPAHQRMQQEMMGVLNAAAIRMESWYNEQTSQREQLEHTVSEVGARMIAESEARLKRVEARFESSATRIEANVRELSVQNDRVEALAGELATTVRELDLTKDQILQLQSDLEHKGQALDTTREKLSLRDHELARQQAKLAALTLILEEGESFATSGGSNGMAAERTVHASRPTSSCTIPQTPTLTEPAPQAQTALYPFRFLPPDHPET